MSRPSKEGTASIAQVIAVGEAMALFTPRLAEPVVDARDFQLDVGGAEANVAAHLAQLGVPATWASRLGVDALADRMIRTLEQRGVDLSLTERREDSPTGLYIKDPGAGVIYYRSGSAASTMDTAFALGLPLDQVAIVHTSGITPALSPACLEMTDTLLSRVGAIPEVLLSFDVNFRPSLWDTQENGAKVLLDFARRADIVFVGLDEAHTLWGCRTADEVRAMIQEPATVVVKNDDIGATEFTMSGTTFVPAIPVEVVEPVGAGDAFVAGYLAALLGGSDPVQRLTEGHIRACLVLRSTSDFSVEEQQ